MITPDNISKHEFIGLDVSIVRSTNSQLIGLNGTIVNETKSMFSISTSSGIKSIPKNIAEWQFVINGYAVVVNGNSIVKRSYERLGVKA